MNANENIIFISIVDDHIVRVDTCNPDNFETPNDFELWNTSPYGIFAFNICTRKIGYREPNAYGDDCDPGEYNVYEPSNIEVVLTPADCNSLVNDEELSHFTNQPISDTFTDLASLSKFVDGVCSGEIEDITEEEANERYEALQCLDKRQFPDGTPMGLDY